MFAAYALPWVGAVPGMHMSRHYTPALMLDRSLRLTFRDFSTYFFIVAAVVLPAELAYGAVFSDVIDVRELHREIERLPEGTALLGVTADRLAVARWSRWALNLVELGLLPWMAVAARRVLDASDRGRVPTAARALVPGRGSGERRGRFPRIRHGRNALLPTTAAISLAIGLLVRYLGELVTDPFQGPGSWALVAVVETVARSTGAPFLLAAAAELARSGEGEPGKVPKQY